MENLDLLENFSPVAHYSTKTNYPVVFVKKKKKEKEKEKGKKA